MSESISKFTSGKANFSALFIVVIGIAIILTLPFVYPVSAGSISWQSAGNTDPTFGAMQSESLSVYHYTPCATFRNSANSEKATVMGYAGFIWHFFCFTLTGGVSAHVK